MLILAIALIVLGPAEMLNTARKLARLINKFVHSPIWKSLVNTSQEIRSLPKKFMAEAGLDETVQELNKMNQQVKEFTRSNPLSTLEQPAAAEKAAPPQLTPVEPPAEPEQKIVPPAVTAQAEPQNASQEAEPGQDVSSEN
ncbi:MAG: hypothetical protein AAGU05_16215, partial [Anaerolineaceae bacterium]